LNKIQNSKEKKMTLLETYAKRLSVADSVYSKAHEGETLSTTKKMAIAMVLNNTNKFMNEAFANSVGTQRSDLGLFKKFTLNLTTVALPNLIAHDLVIVHPMASMSGYITYIKYTAGTTKGETAQGDVFNEPFKLGEVDKNFTSSAVVESVEVASSEGAEVTLAWTPVVADAFGAGKTVKHVATNGDITFLPVVDGKVTVPSTGKIAYMYDNVVIPQNDLPIINAKLASIALVAKARRVAIYYSQIAAFQAKTDYGFDLGDQLAEKAVGQLAYEIDTEITDKLIEIAGEADADLKWSKVIPVGVSKAEHYEGFGEIVEIAKQKIYDRTKRFTPNYMLIASNVLPVLKFLKGFVASRVGSMNGPYLAGTLDGIKVFVTPNIAPGKFILGVNGDDMQSSAAVYAPYMAVVPTQLLGFSDGGMSQGWSTMYALEALNDLLVIAGEVTTDALPPILTAEEQ
jgi:hypothetical protein